MTADQALRNNGFDGDKLLAYANTIARRQPGTLGDRHEDLVMWLTEVGLKAALTYQPTKSRPGYTFSSYIYDIMQTRVPDFYRRKSEGFGDERKGHNGRIVLTDEIDIDTEVEFPEQIRLDEERWARWRQASDKAYALYGNYPTLEEWIVVTLDAAANGLLGKELHVRSA